MTKKPFFMKTNNSPISTLILTMGMAFGMMSDAQATPTIASANGTFDCTACHAGGVTNKTTGQAGISAFCKSKYPTGTGAYSSSFVCTPAAAPTPTPTSVPTPPPTPTPTPTPAPTACNTTGDDSKVVPTLTAPRTVSVYAGEKLTLAVTAFDCADREITIKATSGLPRGAKIVNSFDAQLQMYKAVITWTPPTNAQEQTIKVTLVAVATADNGKKVSSSPKTVSIQVLQANQDHHHND